MKVSLYDFLLLPPGVVVPMSGWGSRERMISQGSDTGSDKDVSPFNRRNSAFMETSPPSSLLYAQSPPNMEGPITFVAPELAEDTLMDVRMFLITVYLQTCTFLQVSVDGFEFLGRKSNSFHCID